jgi:hypothetical protein
LPPNDTNFGIELQIQGDFCPIRPTERGALKLAKVLFLGVFFLSGMSKKYGQPIGYP